MKKSLTTTPSANYIVYADRPFMNFLRPMRDDKFSRMDAYCYLLDRAADSADSKNDSQPFYRNRVQFEVTITELSEAWNWHRATVRNFLDELEAQQRITKQPLSKSYLITINFFRHVPYCQEQDSYGDVADVPVQQAERVSTSAGDSAEQAPTEDGLHIPEPIRYQISSIHLELCEATGVDPLAAEVPMELLAGFLASTIGNTFGCHLFMTILIIALRNAKSPIELVYEFPDNGDDNRNGAAEPHNGNSNGAAEQACTLQFLQDIYTHYMQYHSPVE